jgi:hypothetical protein
MTLEICNMCGKDVSTKSKRFINRIPDFDSLEERISRNVKYPIGDFICTQCDNKANKLKQEDGIKEEPYYIKEYQNSSALCSYRKTCIQHPIICLVCTRRNILKDCYKDSLD